MKKYSDLVDRLLEYGDLLLKLRPTEVADTAKLLRIRAADDATVCGGQAIVEPSMFALVRGGLLYAIDAIDESHVVVQGIDGDVSAYWHGMIHRREGDFDNARYWFRRAGALTFFGELHRRASQVASVFAAQSNWDPYLFTGLCEQDKFGDTEMRDQLVKLQRIEFDAIFDYVWCKSFNLKR